MSCIFYDFAKNSRIGLYLFISYLLDLYIGSRTIYCIFMSKSKQILAGNNGIAAFW